SRTGTCGARLLPGYVANLFEQSLWDSFVLHDCAREPRHLEGIECGCGLHRLGVSDNRGVQPRRRSRYAAEVQRQLVFGWAGRGEFEQLAGPEHGQSRDDLRI